VIYDRLQQRDNQDAQIYPPAEDLPENLVTVDADLYLLGFTQIGRFQRSIKSQEIIVYLHNDRNIMGFALLLERNAYVNICSYLKDSFAINTDFGGTFKVENDKSIRHLVETDLETALAYHEHQLSRYVPEHGKPKSFNTVREILDWEDQHQLVQNTHQDIMKQFRQLGVRYIQAFLFNLFLILLTAGINRLLVDSTDPVSEIAFLDLTTGLLRYFGYLTSIIWVIQPVSNPETVENRKKKELD
ncbi:MAG: hypothetical protein AAFY41_11660, partial [Bacteroidota bacterium]